MTLSNPSVNKSPPLDFLILLCSPKGNFEYLILIDFWHINRRHGILAIEDIFPIQIFEKLVFFQLLGILHATQTTFWITTQKFLNQILCLR